MPDIDPRMAAILAEAAAANLPPRRQLSVLEARAQTREANKRWNARPLEMAGVRDIAIPGPRGPITVRLYHPRTTVHPMPAFLFIHGGGWVICDLDTHDSVCRRFAVAADVVVASIDYALAPEHPYPAGLEDCLAVTRWFADHGADHGCDPSRLAIGGDSAGANLALAALMRFKAEATAPCRAGVLVYGAFSAARDTASHRAFGGGDFLLSSDDMDWFWDHYVADPAARTDPFVAPLHGEVEGLPPLYLGVAALDPLRDDSLELSRRLTLAGRAHVFDLWPGVCHASLHMADEIPVIEDAYRVMGAWLSTTLRG